MRRWLAVFLVAQVFAPSVVFPADNISGATTLSAVGTPTTGANCAVVPLANQQGASVSFDTSTLDGTMLAYLVFDNATKNVQFVDPISGATSLSYVGDGNNDASALGILGASGAKSAMVCLSAVNSGTIAVTLRATTSLPAVSHGSDGSNLRTPVVTNTTPDASAYGWVVRIAGSSGTACSATDDGAFTVGTDCGTPISGQYKSTLDSVDDGDSGVLAMTQKRALYVSHLTPAGDSMVDDTFDAIKAVLEATATIGGKSADATTTNYLNCTSSFNMSTTTVVPSTFKLIDAPTGERVYVCGMILYSNSSTAVNTLSVVRGTGSNCGTGTATILGPFQFDGSKGFAVPPSMIAFLNGGAEDNDICLSYDTAALAFGQYATFPD